MKFLKVKSKRDRNGWGSMCLRRPGFWKTYTQAEKDDTFLNNLLTYVTCFIFQASD